MLHWKLKGGVGWEKDRRDRKEREGGSLALRLPLSPSQDAVRAKPRASLERAIANVAQETHCPRGLEVYVPGVGEV